MAQRGWTEHYGVTDPDEIGLRRGVDVRSGLQEEVSLETSPDLRTPELIALPVGGKAYYMQTAIELGDPLATCREVQQVWLP